MNRTNVVVGAAVVLLVLVSVAIMAAMRSTPSADEKGLPAAGAAGSSNAAPAEAAPAGLRAIVHDSTGAARELDLSTDTELTVSTELGTNVVVVENGAVFVREADCDNRDCIRQGALDAPGKQIICLPHKLWIEVVADGGAPGVMDENAVADGAEALDVTSR